MTSILHESEFTGERYELKRMTINVAFLQEIKEDNAHFRELLEAIRAALVDNQKIRPRVLAELLARLRDELQTHFALEEFFGYFDQKLAEKTSVNKVAHAFVQEHAMLFQQLIELVEDAEQVLYRESEATKSVDEIVRGFQKFHANLMSHEMRESELMMKLWNQETGVGD
jgi:iron-sulfur cluster repair protein YtfE (RIC family)